MTSELVKRLRAEARVSIAGDTFEEAADALEAHEVNKRSLLDLLEQFKASNFNTNAKLNVAVEALEDAASTFNRLDIPDDLSMAREALARIK